jgi:hypothetical protein
MKKPKMSTRILRSSITQERKRYDKFFEIKEDDDEIKDDLIDPKKKKKTLKLWEKLPVDKLPKMYLTRNYIFQDNTYKYKVGFTIYPLKNRLKSLNNQYKSGYDIELIDWFYVSHIDDEKEFHKDNTDILANYRDCFGGRDLELYSDLDIVERFSDYKTIMSIDHDDN